MNVGGERRKTEISTSMGSGDQWEDRSGRGEDWRKRKGEEGRRGDAQEEGSPRGHEELEASAKEPVMTRLPSDQKRRIQLMRRRNARRGGARRDRKENGGEEIGPEGAYTGGEGGT